MVGRDASSGGSQVAHTGTQGVWIMYYNCSEMWGNTHTDIIVCKLWDRIKYTLPPPHPNFPQGPYFAPLYEPLPEHVQFVYDGAPMKLSEKAEEAAGFFAKMLDHEYTKKDIFCQNFFQDWRKVGGVRVNDDAVRNNLREVESHV